MKLSDLRRQQLRQDFQRAPEDEVGAIRHSSAFTRPIEGLYQGQPVTIIASGDIVGMSPALQVVDENGKLDWVSSDDITVTQREFLPQSEQQRNRLRNQSQTVTQQQ
jgi:hypothetical protein